MAGGSSSAHNSADFVSHLLKAPTAEEDATYFQKICADNGGRISVRCHPHRRKGRALFADTFIPQGQVILIETPIVSLQDIENKTEALACSHCLRHAGTLEDQLQWHLLNKERLTKNESWLVQLFENGGVRLPKFGDMGGPVVYCDCGAVYCSDDCKEVAMKSYHQYLCTERLALHKREVPVDVSCLMRFQSFCVDSNPTLYLMAQALCLCQSHAMKQDSPGDEGIVKQRLRVMDAWTPFWHAWRPIWWECVPAPDDQEDTNRFKADLKELIFQASDLLRKAIRSSAYDCFLHPEVVGAVMGMIEQNNITVSLPSPLELYIDHLNEADDHLIQSLWETYPGLKETLIEAAQHSMEGSGYFCLACCANHSCCPNAQDSKREGVDLNHDLILTAVKDIQAGEEITISYIDENMSYEERTSALHDYGFLCDCPKCEGR